MLLWRRGVLAWSLSPPNLNQSYKTAISSFTLPRVSFLFCRLQAFLLSPSVQNGLARQLPQALLLLSGEIFCLLRGALPLFARDTTCIITLKISRRSLASLEGKAAVAVDRWVGQPPRSSLLSRTYPPHLFFFLCVKNCPPPFLHRCQQLASSLPPGSVQGSAADAGTAAATGATMSPVCWWWLQPSPRPGRCPAAASWHSSSIPGSRRNNMRNGWRLPLQ